MKNELEKLDLVAKAVLASMGEAVFVCDQDRNIFYANPAAEQLTGWMAKETTGKKCWRVFGDPEWKCRLFCPAEKVFRTGEPAIREGEMKTRDGRVLKMRFSISPLKVGDRIAGTTVVIEEITDLKRMEQHLAELKRQAEKDITGLKRVNEEIKKTADRLKTVFDSIDAMMFIVDGKFNVVDVNRARLKMFKLSFKDALGKKCYKIFHDRNRPCKECPIRSVFEDGKATRMEKIAVIGGVTKYFDSQGVPIFDEEKKVIAAINHATDITEKKRAEEALRECSIKDELTNLFNYRYLQDRLEEEIKRAQRYEEPVSLLILDLDNFKAYNDSCGHLVGNEILEGVADLLKTCVRDVDIVARYGGDEFCVILPQTGKNEAFEVAERIRITMENHDFPQKKRELGNLTVSLGLVACPVDGKNLKGLLRVADEALYEAKNAGGNRIVTTV